MLWIQLRRQDANINQNLRGGTSLSDLGFKNVPEGDWVLKSTALGDAFPGLGENIIPLVLTSISGNTTQIGYSTQNNGGRYIGTASINGIQAEWHQMYIDGNGEIVPQLWGNGTAYKLFLPAFFGYDLTATQKGVTQTNIEAWLQKE